LLRRCGVGQRAEQEAEHGAECREACYNGDEDRRGRMNPAPGDKGGEHIVWARRIELAAGKLAMLLAVALAATPVMAQDIAGLEDCAQAKGPDKKIGCLQSNVEFLHKLIKTSDTAAQAKLSAANLKISELQAQIERLKTALDQLEKKIPPAHATAPPAATPPATPPAAKP